MLSDLLVGSIIYVSLTLLTLVLVLLHKRMVYWRQRGISHQLPSLLFGNLPGVNRKRSLRDVLLETYEKFKGVGENFCGFYWLTEPAVFILNKKLGLQILSNNEGVFSVCFPESGRFSKKLEVLQPDILKSSLKIFEESLKGSMEKVCDVHDICKRYTEKVLQSSNHDENDLKKGLTQQNNNQKREFEQRFLKTESKTHLQSNTMFHEIFTSLLCCTLHELAKDTDKQEEIYNDILLKLKDDVYNSTYECLENVSSLRNQVKAVLCLCTPIAYVTLRALKEYTTNQPGYSIDRGNLVIIPIEAMEQNIENCTGLFECSELTSIILGNTLLCQIYRSIILILKDFKFNTCTETPMKINFRERMPHTSLDRSIYLKIEKR